MRGQSEALGFVLVFSLIVTTVGLVYASGAAGLDAARDDERVRNAERAFEVFAGNVDDLRDGADGRATEVSLNGGTVALGSSVTVEVYAANATNASRNRTYTTTLRPVVYEFDDTRVVYANGALIRADPRGSVMRSAPSWLVDGERAVVPFTTTYAATNLTSVGGDRTALLVAERRSQGLVGTFDPGTADARVNVTVDSPRAEAWGRFLSDQGYTPVDDDPSDGNVTYQFTTNRLHVTRLDVPVELK